MTFNVAGGTSSHEMNVLVCSFDEDETGRTGAPLINWRGGVHVRPARAFQLWRLSR